ncbi:putative multidrug resistance protein E [Trypanosoma cruzi]|nr:putative multidrug resistance protein E [Trypanosoma cruzi]
MRYRAGLPLVLDRVSFLIEPRQKVGVVGRTGSGKSTLLLTLMRMVDICGGDIIGSGRPICAYGLRELRQQFSMIPQDPVLFDGTVRSNLDPFLESTPAEVWRALDLVGMRERVELESGGIEGRVQEGGSNYSVGQRQLLCLARALLRRGSGFILMDEATANIDHALDQQIQHTVMTAFNSHTVITIAHRLHTVAAYDKIIVMDHGVVAESGSPRELVSDPSSRFSELVAALGKQEAAKFMASVGVAAAS